jgi:hypothetical protein
MSNEIYQRTGDRLDLLFHRGQWRAWESDRRFVFVLAGTQGGKTSFGPWWLQREIYGDDTRAGMGQGDYLAVTESFDLFKLKLLPEMRDVFETITGMGRYWAGDKIIELRDPESGKFLAQSSSDRMWGRIILRSASAEGGLESSTAKAAWLDECGQDGFRLSAWEAVLRRLSLYQGRVLGTTTLYNLGWMKQEIYDKWQAGDSDIDVVQFASVMNPSFPQAEFERAQRTLPEWKFRMFYLGEFTRPAGLIYGDFTDLHKVKDFAVPAEWPRYVGVDFGGVHTAKVWIAHDIERAAYYVYRVTLDGDKTTRQHVLDTTEQARGERVVATWGGAKSEEQWRRDWGDAGWPIQEPPISDVEGGIDRVISLLKTHQLYVMESCRPLLDELGTYSREVDERGNPTEKIKDKNDFHCCDALRYLVSGIMQQSGAWAFLV